MSVPPCTITRFIPTSLSSAMSRANEAFSSAPIAAPPYLITTVSPANSRMYGSASSRPTRGSRSVLAALGSERVGRRLAYMVPGCGGGCPGAHRTSWSAVTATVSSSLDSGSQLSSASYSSSVMT